MANNTNDKPEAPALVHPFNRVRAPTGTPFVKGQSGNPAGSAGRAYVHKPPRGYRERIDQATKGGAELISFLLGVMRSEIGAMVEDKTGEDGSITYKLQFPTIQERLKACDQLSQRLWGQARQEIAIGPLEQRAQELAQLPAEELEGALRRVLGSPDSQAANDAPEPTETPAPAPEGSK